MLQNSGSGHPLESAKAKVDRAKEHLDALDLAVDVFSKHPRQIIRKDDLERGLHTVEFVTPDIDFRMAAIAGDVVCCLRSALDHVAWELAFDALGRKKRPSKSTKFPICPVWNDSNIGQFKESTKHISAKARASIQTLQPYNSGDAYRDSLLWQLNELCNIDKHRRIAIFYSGLRVYFPNFPERLFSHIQYFEDEHMVAVPLSMKGYMDFDQKAAIEIFFGDKEAGLSVSPARLRQIYEFIGESVLPRFSGFFK